MTTKRSAAKNIDEYIAGFPSHVQEILEKIRMTIRDVAPEAKETISYGIPAFTLYGILIYFAGFTRHVSVYPAPRGAEQFKDELSAYKGGKGTVQFPLDQPIPYDLVRRIVLFRLQENLAKAEAKKNKK